MLPQDTQACEGYQRGVGLTACSWEEIIQSVGPLGKEPQPKLPAGWSTSWLVNHIGEAPFSRLRSPIRAASDKNLGLLT